MGRPLRALIVIACARASMLSCFGAASACDKSSSEQPMSGEMRCDVRTAKIAHPTGDPSFEVLQAFPAAFSEQESDPFLMCDEVGPALSHGAYGNDTDEGFSVDWHPHCGMEILSYMVEGCGRHADSMGNRETFKAPGFQWLSVGSGIEHAEGGGTPAGERRHSFQIWLRMPTQNMEDDPRYGIVEDIPTVDLGGGSAARVIAGALDETIGPAQYAVTVQILDVELAPGASWTYTVPDGMDNAMWYVFKGSGMLAAGTKIEKGQIGRFDTSSAPRSATFTAGKIGSRMMVFTGRRTNERLVWHGPFVSSSRAELARKFRDFQTGRLPRKRVSWDYRDVGAIPKDRR